MAERKKRPLGFETSSMRIQEEYEEILKKIMAKKTDWEQILTNLEKIANFYYNKSREVLKKSEDITEEVPKEAMLAQMMRIEYEAVMSLLSLTLLSVAKVGKELAECDLRIAAIEKELKGLKRGMR